MTWPQDVEVVADYLNPETLLAIVQALGTPKMDEVRSRLIADRLNRTGVRKSYSTTDEGISVARWPGVEPCTITWQRVFSIVRSRAHPALVDTLVEACARAKAAGPYDSDTVHLCDAARAATTALLGHATAATNSVSDLAPATEPVPLRPLQLDLFDLALEAS